MNHFYKQFIFTKQFIFVVVAVAILVAGGVLIFAFNEKGAGPVAWWKFDEGTASSTYDSSGNANTGTLTGGVQWADGVYGSGLSFDGVDDDLSIANSDAWTFNAMTVSGWFKVNSFNASFYQGLLARQPNSLGGFAIGFSNATTMKMRVSTGAEVTLTVPYAPVLNNWFYASLIYDGSYIKGYINGVFISQIAQTGAIPTSPGNLLHFAQWDIGTYRLGCSIDDVKIYNYARTADQIKRDYNNGKALYLGTKAPASCDVDPASCVNKGLVGYWAMDEMGSTTVKDLSGNNNNGLLGAGVVGAMPKWAQGVQPFSGGRPGGGALKFDGVNDYVDIGDMASLNLSTTFTLSAWIKLNTLGSYQAIIAKDNYVANQQAYYIDVNSNNQVRFEGDPATSINGVTLLTTGVWYHVVGTYDGSTATIYLNGKYDNSALKSWNLSNNAATVKIGKMRDGATEYFNGLIDDVRIYNRALSATEIQYQYNQGKPIAWWKMDEGTASSTYDSSGNANTGTLTGGVQWASGVYGTGLSFDGVNDFVSVGDPSLLKGMSGLTISAWFKADVLATGGLQTLVAKYGGSGVSSAVSYYLMVYDEGSNNTTQLRYLVSNGSTSGVANGVINLTAGNWYHAVLTWDGSSGTATLYLNGVQDILVYSGVIGTINSITTPVNIGARNSGTERFLDGSIDDVKIYNYARTADQIKRDYNNGKALYLGTKAPASCDVDPASCINKGLVGYWAMDEMGSTTVKDLSGNNNNGLLGGGTAAARPVWAKGVQPFSGGRSGGGALKFDGVNDYVSVGTIFSQYNTLTLSAWVNVPNATGNRIIHGAHSSGTGFYNFNTYISNSSNSLYFVYVWNNGGTPTVEYIQGPAVTQNTWQNVVVTFNQAENYVYFYINGVKTVGTVNFVTKPMVAVVQNLRIGSLGGANYFNGSIDGVRVYNRALSATEIQYQYNQGKPIAWWKMDEGANSSTTCNATTSNVYDYSGNGNTGALSLGASPATSTAWTDGKYGCGLTFDGSNDYVQLPSSITGSTVRNFEAWVKGTGQIFQDGNGYFVIYSNSTSLNIKIHDGACCTTPLSGAGTFNDSTWNHIVVTWGSGRQIFINGILKASDGDSRLPWTPAAARIGYGNSNWLSAGMFNGIIDDVRIYNYARTADQIRQDYTAGSALH